MNYGSTVQTNNPNPSTSSASNTTGNSKKALIIGLGVSMPIAFILLLVGGYFVYKRYKRSKASQKEATYKKQDSFTKENDYKVVSITPPPYSPPDQNIDDNNQVEDPKPTPNEDTPMDQLVFKQITLHTEDRLTQTRKRLEWVDTELPTIAER